MPSPRYFFAMFGDPKPPKKDRVESGIYHPNRKTAPFPTQPGDLLLLYCTENYAEHPMQVPGLGVVLHKTDEIVSYRYLPLSKPIPKAKIEASFLSKEDSTKFRNRRFNIFWLFEISRASFVATVGIPDIAWP